jgi:hypothetical protein
LKPSRTVNLASTPSKEAIVAKTAKSTDDSNSGQLYPDFDPAVETPTANEAGAGQPLPGSPYVQDLESRDGVEERIAEISREPQWPSSTGYDKDDKK